MKPLKCRGRSYCIMITLVSTRSGINRDRMESTRTLDQVMICEIEKVKETPRESQDVNRKNTMSEILKTIDMTPSFFSFT